MKGPIHLQDVNRAREFYNPLRGLDMPRLVRLLEESERGRHADLQWLNRTVEKRHPTLRALKARRLGALKKLDWDVVIPGELPAGATTAQAEAQQAYLRAAYERIENLPQAVEHLALATFRGFAHLELRHEDDRPSRPVVRLLPVPQWHFLRDHQTWAWRYDATARGQEAGSVELAPGRWISREVEDPLCEIALICFLRRNLAEKDWTAFVDDYGIPSIFATLGENSPAEKVKEWLAIVEKVTGNSRGALPPGASVNTLDLGAADGVQFKNFIGHQDEALVLAGTGGLLTMLTASTGLNSDQGDTHEDTFDAIALAEAREIDAILQAQHDKPLLAAEFPGQPILAYFRLAAEDEEDLDQLAERVVKFYSAGLHADPAEISEKSGLTLSRGTTERQSDGGQKPEGGGQKPEDGTTERRSDSEDEPLTNRATTATEAAQRARFEAAASAAAIAGEREAMRPLLAALAPALLVIDDDAAFSAELARLAPQLAEIEARILAEHPALEQAIEGTLAAAFANGVSEAAEARRKPAEKAAKTPAGVSTPVPGGRNPAVAG